MKRTMFGALALTVSAIATAQEMRVTGTASVTYVTKDVWRGINLVDDSCLMGRVDLSFNKFSGFLEGRMELTDTNSYPATPDPTGELTAVRGGVFYRFNYGQGMNVVVGALAHQYPGVGQDQTQEVYYGLDFGGIGDFMISVYQDVEVVKGYRVVASASHEFPGGFTLPGGGSQNIKLSASVAYGNSAYNSYYYGTDSSTLTDLEISASTSFGVGTVKVMPFLAYTSPLDPDILKGMPNRTNLRGGIGLGISF